MTKNVVDQIFSLFERFGPLRYGEDATHYWRHDAMRIHVDLNLPGHPDRQ